MSSKTLAICYALGVVSVLTACGPGGGDPPPVEATRRYILSAADIPAVTGDPGAAFSVGFNIDDRVSDGTGPNCDDEEDFTSTISGETGVDNQLAQYVVPLLTSMPDFADGLGPVLAEQIAQGTFLLVMDVTSNGIRNDDTVSVHLFLGTTGTPCDNAAMMCPAGAICDPDATAADPATCGPVTDADGLVVPGQVFMQMTEVAMVTGTITNGHLSIELDSLPLNLAVSGETLALNLENARVGGDLTEDAITNGEIGAQVSVAQIVALAASLGVSGIDETTIRAVAHPDLEPTSDPTICAAISAGLMFSAVSATAPAAP